jgi:5-bromo-4-chloroindolyl phosphate hydrolysis protein
MMYRFLSVFIRLIIAILMMIIIGLVSFFSYDQSIMSSLIYSLVGGVLTYGLLSVYLHFRFLKKHRLAMKDYRYIRKNLEEAKQKIRRMQKALFSLRELSTLRDIVEVLRIVRKIYSVTKKEPKRFFKGEKFFYSHLDSAVQLIEKYALLSKQPLKKNEVGKALSETRILIKELKIAIEDDLYHILADDIDQLQFEIDVAKLSANRTKNS